MAAPTTCEVCGTVNVLASGRCMACGQPLPGAVVPRRPASAFDDSPTATTGSGADEGTAGTSPATPEDRTLPVDVPGDPAGSESPPTTAPVVPPPVGVARGQETIPVSAPPQVPPAPAVPSPAVPAPRVSGPPSAPVVPSVRPAPPRPAPVPPAAGPGRSVNEVEAAAGRRTAIEGAGAGPSVDFDDDALAAAALSAEPAAPRPRPSPDAPVPTRSRASDETFTVRLLLPEGDKRMVEVGGARVNVGSGLDEIGLPGDPKARASEARLWVEGGRLWIETAPESAGVYVRLDGEATLAEGDVVLMGDIAAEFRSSPHFLPIAAEPLVLGGGAATPFGRLLFLRRDGSPGPAHDLPAGKTIVGRTDGHLNFPSDSRLSRRHVRFHATDDGVTVEDLDSRNGTYLRIRGKRRLDVGDALRIGSAGAQIRARS